MKLYILFLSSFGTLYALYEDRKKDTHPNHDLVYVTIIHIVTSGLATIAQHPFQLKLMGVYFALSWGIFIGFFDYAINIIYGHKNTLDPWWDHLSKSAVPDKWPIWYKLQWWVRMVIRLSIFIITLMIFLYV